MRKLLTTVVVLLVLLLAVDRLGAYVAGRVVAGRLRSSAGLTADPHVTVRGFPFLTQAVAGVYDDLELQADDVDRGGVRLQRVTASLYGVHAALGELASGSVRQVPVDRIDATVLIAYATVQDRGRTRGLTVRPQGRQLVVTGRVTVLGQTASASTTATVRLDGNDLVLTSGQVSVGGISTDALAGALDLRVPVGRLPYGLRLTGVTATPTGLLVTARTGPTVLDTGSARAAGALRQS